METTAGGSGYSVLGDYLPEAERISGRRREPRGFFQRGLTVALSRAALTRWYKLSSAQLEWRAWRRGLSFEGIFHIMWADRDLGFLDMLRNRARHKLCGTFHCCPDTLPETLQFAGRLRALDAIILMSDVQREFFEKRGVPPEKIHVVLHGVDTNYFSPRPDRKREGVFQVLSVGSYRRNFGLLRRVCELMGNDNSVQFKIVAPSQWQSTFSGMKNVQVTSRLTDEELLDSYRNADCFLLTAEAATANNALLEALACGLPVAGEAAGGIPEYTSPDCAKLVPAGSEAGLVDALRMLMKNRGEQERMSLSARRRAEELDWAKVAERTREVYRKIKVRG